MQVGSFFGLYAPDPLVEDMNREWNACCVWPQFSQDKQGVMS